MFVLSCCVTWLLCYDYFQQWVNQYVVILLLVNYKTTCDPTSCPFSFCWCPPYRFAVDSELHVVVCFVAVFTFCRLGLSFMCLLCPRGSKAFCGFLCFCYLSLFVATEGSQPQSLLAHPPMISSRRSPLKCTFTSTCSRQTVIPLRNFVPLAIKVLGSLYVWLVA